MHNFERTLLLRLKVYFIPLIAAIFVIGATVVYVVPTIKASFSTYAILDEKKVQLANLEKKRSLLTSIASSTLVLLAEAEKTLPQEKDAASILTALDNLAASTQQGIDSIDLNPGVISTRSAETAAADSENTRTVQKPAQENPVEKNGAYAMQIQVATRGTTAQFTQFMTQIQKSKRIFDIEQLTVTYILDAEDFLTADFILNAYYLPPITEISKIEEPLPEFTAEEKVSLELLASLPYISAFAQTATESGVPVAVGKTDLFH